MKYRIAKTLEEWARVQSLGTYEQDFKDGSLWSFGGDCWYLAFSDLSSEVLCEVKEFYSGLVTI